MSRKEAVILASRVLGVLLAVWALSDASYLPERVLMLLHYTRGNRPAYAEHYWLGYEIAALGSLLIRITGFSLMSGWLLKGGSEIEELLLPNPQGSGGAG